MALTSRERVLQALAHQEADRVPMDIGGTSSSTIAVGPYRRVAEMLGIDIEPIYLPDVTGQTVDVNAAMQAALGSDARMVTLLPAEWTPGRAYDGTPVQVPAAFQAETLPDGAKVLRDGAGTIVSKMPRGGFFYDRVHHPLQHITEASQIGQAAGTIRTFNRPAWLDLPLEQVGAHARHLREAQERLLVGDFQGHLFAAAQHIRGWGDFMLDLADNPVLAEALLDAITEAQMANFDHFAATVGPHVDVITLCDDLGMQDMPWMSPKTYRNHVKPYHRQLYAHIKQRCPHCFIQLHSDGAIFPLIEDLIEVGVDILNPVQYSCSGMDLKRLKKEFGDHICFWGAGIDTQKTLPFGTPAEVADEVKRNIDILAPGGGFVFAAVHNILEGVPTENIVTAFETACTYGRNRFP